ncbi:MAG: penicillin-binding protein activator [Acetobacter sp.]|nr:penicillin-binding protein activator [Acetobacter sp.]
MGCAYGFPKVLEGIRGQMHSLVKERVIGGIMQTILRGKLKWVVLSCVVLSDCAHHTPSRQTYQRNFNQRNFTPSAEAPLPHRVGVLLPLSGPNEALGRELLAGVRLALTQKTATLGSDSPMIIDVHNTAGNSDEGDSKVLLATHEAIQRGDGFLIGPLTSAETSLSAPIAVEAHVPMLTLTSDSDQGRAGVWVMGITPEEQVQALVEYAQNTGKQHFAALLPDNRLGHVMGKALQAICQNQDMSDPNILYYAENSESIQKALQQLLADNPRSQTDQQGTQQETSSKENSNTPQEALPPDLAAALGESSLSNGVKNTNKPVVNNTGNLQVSPEISSKTAPYFDALLLGDTGLGLKLVMTALAQKHIGSPNVQIMGPGLWAAFSSKLGAIQGAWFAAPNPVFRQSFVARFMAQNNHVPKPLTDLSYDAAEVARAAALGNNGQFDRAVLTRRSGFQGVDGQFYLLPDGRVKRALAIFEIQGLGVPAHVIAISHPNDDEEAEKRN